MNVRTDAVEAFCAGSVDGDIDAVVGTLSPTAELVSPLSGRMVFVGRHDIGILLTAVFGSLRDLRWRQVPGSDDTRVAISEARIMGVRLTDAMVVELDADGYIARLRPHLRPWLALTLVAVALLPKLVRHPAVVMRAVKSGSR